MPKRFTIVTWRGDQYTLAQLARKIATECGINKKTFLDAMNDVIHESKKEG